MWSGWPGNDEITDAVDAAAVVADVDVVEVATVVAAVIAVVAEDEEVDDRARRRCLSLSPFFCGEVGMDHEDSLVRVLKKKTWPSGVVCGSHKSSSSPVCWVERNMKGPLQGHELSG